MPRGDAVWPFAAQAPAAGCRRLGADESLSQRDALIGGDIPQRIEEFERAALRLIQSVDRDAGKQEGKCKGEDQFHFASALPAALRDIFNFVSAVELFHFEVSNKGPAGNILQVSALLNRHKI